MVSLFPLAKGRFLRHLNRMEAHIKVATTPADVARQAADIVVASAQSAIAEKGSFSLALSGGRTPEALYTLLASEPYRSQVDWSRTEFYFGDERCVPPDSPQSNYGMARRTLAAAPIPETNFHRMRGEIEPEQAAREYGQLLKQKFGDGGIDLVLLGMGDDGHTASLFPHTSALDEQEHRCVANYVEKLSTSRITLTAPFINRSGGVLVLVAGAEKAARVHEVLEGAKDPHRLPIQMINPGSGRLTWILDAGAAGMHN